MTRAFDHRLQLGIAKPAGVTLEQGVPVRILLLAWLLVLVGVRPSHAADPRPVVGPGATKDEVIDAYGWPAGQSKSGTKEILNYPQGQVTLENGRVERVDFSMNVPWATPRPRPGPPSATTVRKPEAPVDFWVTSFDEAVREAVRRRARILVLFSGSDWSPASKLFHDEVEFHPDFVNAFTGDFVFLRLDFASRAAMAADLREQNTRLRERYGVTTYPTLLVLSTEGNVVAAVDLTKPQPGDSYRARVIAAVREVRDLLALRPPDPIPPITESAPAPALGGAPVRATAPTQAVPDDASALPAPPVKASLISARGLIAGALVGGSLLAAVMLWLVWRNTGGPKETRANFAMAGRISDAASGLPSPAQMLAWPKERVCAVVAALAESDGYVAEVQPDGSDKDIVLKRRGEPQPRVLICCAGGPAGVVPAKKVRELFGTLTAEGVAVGWFVSPGGFAADARADATKQAIVLIDGAGLLAQLRDLPPLLLPKVLSRV